MEGKDSFGTGYPQGFPKAPPFDFQSNAYRPTQPKGNGTTTFTNLVPHQRPPPPKANYGVICTLIVCGVLVGVTVIGIFIFAALDSCLVGLSPKLDVNYLVVTLSPLSNVSSTSPPTIDRVDVGFVLKTPNKFGNVYYDHMEVSVNYTNEFLMKTILRPFYQPEKNQTGLKANMSVVHKPEEWISTSVYADMRNIEHVDLVVSLVGWINYVHMWWKSGTSWMSSSCYIRVGSSSSNTTTSTWRMLDGLTTCVVYVH